MIRKILLSTFVVVIAYFYYGKKDPVRLGKLVETNSGLIQGSIGVSRDGNDFYQFLRIPFAQPPVGQLRFATPKPVQKWEGILDGTKYGKKCTQLGIFGVDGHEDCLQLNIFVPKMENVEKQRLLPVLVWIHGGGFYVGSSIDFGPDYFMDEQVVLITLNYRLNVFGFLSTGDKEIRGNMGLKDQVLALQWIQENVKYFGGDPSKVTIFGESAGGISVHYLTLAEKAKGLFQKAISMSGVANAIWAFRSSQETNEKTQTYAKELGCPIGNSKDMTDCLRQISTENLAKVYKKDMVSLSLFDPTLRGELPLPVVEVVDDEETFLKETPHDLLIQGKAQKVPLLVGGVAEEGLLTSLAFERDPENLPKMQENWESNIEFSLGYSKLPQREKEEINENIKEFYFSKNENQNDQDKKLNYTRIFSEGFFHNYISQVASTQRKFSPVYLYYFNKTGGPSIQTLFSEMGRKHHMMIELISYLIRSTFNKYVLGLPSKNFGICHGDDIPMLFPFMGFFKIPKDDGNEIYHFSKDFVKLITEFATDEKSMKFKSVPFPPTPKEGKLKYFKIDDEPGVIDEPNENSMEFWKSLKIQEKYSRFVQNSK